MASSVLLVEVCDEFVKKVDGNLEGGLYHR